MRMLPYEKEQIKERLIRGGYFRHRVERMQPWTLMHCLRLIGKPKKGGPSPAYLPYAEPPYMSSSVLTKVWKETVIKGSSSIRDYR